MEVVTVIVILVAVVVIATAIIIIIIINLYLFIPTKGFEWTPTLRSVEYSISSRSSRSNRPVHGEVPYMVSSRAAIVYAVLSSAETRQN